MNVYKSILYTCIEAFKLYSSESLHKLLNIMEINEMSFFLAPLKIPQCKIFYVGFQTCNNKGNKPQTNLNHMMGQ